MYEILIIDIEKQEHVKSVLEKIEEKYPQHRWAGGDLPTEYIPEKANLIIIYDYGTILYSTLHDLTRYTNNSKCKRISSSEFLEIEKGIYNRAIDDFVKEFKRKTQKKNRLVDKIAEQLKKK